jgi:hypothetical protein
MASPPEIIHEDILDPILLGPFVESIKVSAIFEASKIKRHVVPARALLRRPPMIVVE